MRERASATGTRSCGAECLAGRFLGSGGLPERVVGGGVAVASGVEVFSEALLPADQGVVGRRVHGVPPGCQVVGWGQGTSVSTGAA